MEERYSACELVEIGIQVEKNGREFYLELAKKDFKAEAVKAFKFLAEEEEKHIKVFDRIFSSACEYEPEGAYPDDYFAYMNALARQYIFTQGKGRGKEAASAVKDFADAVDLGIGFEKDSIIFYEGMKKIIAGKDHKIIDKVITEEQKHLARLFELKKG